MLRFRLTGPYRVPAPLVFRLVSRHVEIVYPDPPRLVMSVGTGWSSAVAWDVRAGDGFVDVPPRDAVVVLGHELAANYDVMAGDSWRQAGTLDVMQRAGWSAALARSVQIAQAWGSVAAHDSAAGIRWQQGAATDQQALRAGWQQAVPADTGSTVLQRDVDRYGAEWRYAEALPPYLPGTRPVRFRFNGARYRPQAVGPVYFQLGRDLRGRPTQPRDSSVSVGYGSSRAVDVRKCLPWGTARPVDAYPTGITYPDYDGPVIIIEPPAEPEILETYMIVNSVSCVVLPSGTPLQVSDLRLRLDIDSYSWSFSFVLEGATAIALVRPDIDGPKTLEITINGWVWRVLAEKNARAGQFSVERYTITGTSRQQYLAAPYAPLRSAVNSLDINARQVMDAQLLNTGFTIEWDVDGLGPPDWTIPAGALTYHDQTPMQIIARVAEAAGAVVRPAPDSDTLEILQRYRDPPWYWSETIVDRIIAGEVITNVSSEWSPQPQWNSVYVSGTTHGVAVDVRRAGTAGNDPAPDVFDDLITATPAARSRGICELSKGGNQELTSLTIPLFPVGGSAPGLVLPAHLVEVREFGQQPWRGLCLGVDISATGTGASVVNQVLSIERHHREGA